MKDLRPLAKATSRVAAAVLVLAIGLLASCSNDPAGPPGHLVVSVTGSGNVPESGKVVEIVGTGHDGRTDENGVAEFYLAPGFYTVRVYDIGFGGPRVGIFQQVVRIGSGQSTTVEVFDCTVCV